MPIYAYRCEACGFAKDALQKMSDPVLTVCPSCNQSTFKKQVTAAGFQLKGTGWYVTDFRNGSGAKGAAPTTVPPAGAAAPAAPATAGAPAASPATPAAAAPSTTPSAGGSSSDS